MSYSIEIKLKALKKIKDGKKIKDIAQEMKISQATLYNWKREMEQSTKTQQRKELGEEIPKQSILQPQTSRENISSVQEDKANKRKIRLNHETEIRKYNDTKEISKRIKDLIKERKFYIAKKLGEAYLEDEIIQSQMVTIAIRERDYERAKKIGEKFPNDEAIQSQMVTIAVREGDFNRAKKIGEKFPNAESIQSQMITIEIRERDYERAKETTNMKKDIDEIIISRITSNNGNEKRILHRLKTQIYYNQIDDEMMNEIEMSEELSDFEKTVSMLAICEKRNMKQKAKEISKKFIPSNKREKNTINDILERIQSKKQQIFDWAKYDSILHWSFDDELREKFEIEKQTNAEKVGKKAMENTVKGNKDETARVTSGQQILNKSQVEIEKTNPNTNFRKSLVITNNSQPNASYKQKSEKKSRKKEEIINKENSKRNQTKKMTDYIQKFIKEQRKRVYVNMQSQDAKIQADAISKWDRIEVLLDKIAERNQDSDYLESLYNRIVDLENRRGIEL